MRGFGEFQRAAARTNVDPYRQRGNVDVPITPPIRASVPERTVSGVNREIISPGTLAVGVAPSATMKAVIFDVDGTLVDSVDLHAEAWKIAFARFGHKFTFARIR